MNINITSGTRAEAGRLCLLGPWCQSTEIAAAAMVAGIGADQPALSAEADPRTRHGELIGSCDV